MTNQEILQKLRRLHTLLVLGKRSNNLAQAIRRAMDNIASWKHSVQDLLARASIRQIFPNYGPKFIKIFEELIHTGNIQLIDQLQPEFDPFFCYLCEIPGIGETMARRMFFDRSIHSMDDLRIAYSNNVLQRIPAFGDSRLHTIEDILWKSQTGLSDNTDLSDDNLSSEDILMDMPVLTDGPLSNSIQLDLFSSPAVSWSQASSSVHEIPPANKPNNSGAPSVDNISSGNVFPDEPIQSCEPDDNLSLSDPIEQDTDSRCDSFHKQNAAFLNRTNGASDSYHRQFVESNSSLFRDEKCSQPFPKIESDHISDVNPAIQADENMTNEIVNILDTPATPTPELKEELDAFIEKDLRTHGLLNEENSVAQYAVLKAKTVQAEVIRANFIRTETIESEIIILEDLAINSQNKGARQIENVEFPTIEADVIEADWIRAKEIHVRYLTAGIIIRSPKN